VSDTVLTRMEEVRIAVEKAESELQGELAKGWVEQVL
jgi:hypothetical protein